MKITSGQIFACLICFALGGLITGLVLKGRSGSGIEAIAAAESFPDPPYSREVVQFLASDLVSRAGTSAVTQSGPPARSARLQRVAARLETRLQPVALLPALQGPNENVFTEPVFTLRGKAHLRGVPPPEKQLPLEANCAQQHPNGATTRFYVVGPDGGFGDVLIFISDGLPDVKWPMPNAPLILTQPGCIYEPYVSAARAGQPIQVQNLSPIMHNIHPTPTVRGNREFNFAQLPNAKPIEFSFSVPELFLRLKCDVHPWEYAYISIFNHPFFAVTDEKGEFTLPPLPKGNYTLEAYHRKAGVQQQQIEITGKPEPLNLFFEVPEDP